MPFVSEIDLGLPETPVGIHQHVLYEEFLRIYNALRVLQNVLVTDIIGTQGPQGVPGLSGLNDAVPYFIISGQTFFFPAPYQFLFVTIDNEGIIDCEGLLIEVD